MMKTKQTHMRFLVGGVVTATLTLSADAAFASSITSIISGALSPLGELNNFLSFLAYLSGILVGFSAVLKLKQHVDAPNQVMMREVWLRMIACGLLVALPTFAGALVESIGTGDGSGSPDYGGGDVGGSGLDAMMLRLMSAVYTPMKAGLPLICYVIGASLAMVGLHRLTKAQEAGPRGPAGRGTLTTFLVAAVMFSIPGTFGAFQSTLLGGQVSSSVSFNYAAGEGMTNLNNAIPGILMFAAFLGWVAFVRGFLIMRSIADGGQGSMAGAMTHVIGGVLAANLPTFINALQTTLGISIATVS